jgi:aspartate carbamoyltransferase catalytic subunit
MGTTVKAKDGAPRKARRAAQLSSRHLLGLEGMPAEDIQLILETAVPFKEILERPIKKVPPLRGMTVVNLFYEPSTRTRISFELAEKRLSADVVSFTTSSSSVQKGETLKDTIKNIEAMKTDVVVIRHSFPGAAHYLTTCCSSIVINAGDGAHEHPTQGLLDIYTLWEKFGSLKGRTILIVGDIAHSRVARSNIFGLVTLGATVRVCGPPTLIPVDVDKLGVEVFYDLDQALAGVDAINVLRIQKERQSGALLPSLREYTLLFGLNRERLRRAGPDVVVMHPGPMNRGVEITPEVADGPQSVILSQVTNGLAVRMAVLYLLCGGGKKVNRR